MKKVVLAALMLGGLSQAAGCIITSDDDDMAAQFDIRWTLTGDAGTLNCAAAGVDTIKVTSRGSVVDFVDLFDCTDNFNATGPLPLDDYLVWIDALDAGNNLVAQSNSQAAILDLDGELVTVNFDFPVDGGFFALTWDLVDSTNAALTCAEVSADTVEVVATPLVGGGAGLDIPFNCTAFEGITDKLPLDTYQVVVELREDGNADALGTSRTTQETLDYGNELIDLGDFIFTFE